jgi:hypothetical protein
MRHIQEATYQIGPPVALPWAEHSVSVVEDYAKEGAVYLLAAVGLTEADLFEFVHEHVDAGAGGADVFAESLLRDFGENSLRLVAFAELSQEQERAGQATFGTATEPVFFLLKLFAGR